MAADYAIWNGGRKCNEGMEHSNIHTHINTKLYRGKFNKKSFRFKPIFVQDNQVSELPQYSAPFLSLC